MIRARIAVILLVVLAVVSATGCSKEAEVVAGWPVADAERTTPKPPEPLLWPLTGLDAPSADAIGRRVISVKIENSPAARPQSGLQSADVVYESVAEGGITRFNVMFHSTMPDPIGPVRSARLSDITIVPQYDGLFVFSGSSSSVGSAIRNAGLPNLSQDAGVSSFYYRSRERAAPHNLYAHLDQVHAEAERRGMRTTAERRSLAFSRTLPEGLGGTAVTTVNVPFSQANRVLWTYDAGRGVFLRDNNGSRHNDALTGEQIAARNVVVMWARHVPKGGGTYDIELAGSGRTSVFRDGVRIDGTWEATREAPPVLTAADGTQIKLAPGNTWFQVVATDVQVTAQ
jgi:hypothetical protein